MKPREMYSGAAPSAMGQMGSGLMEMGGNVGKITASGYEAMGKGIASGISSLGQAYGDYKQAKTANDITRIALDDPEYRKMLGVTSDEDAEAIKKNLKMTIDKYGQIGGAQFSKQYLAPLQQYQALGQAAEREMRLRQTIPIEQADLYRAQADAARAQAQMYGRSKTGGAPLPDYSSGINFDHPLPKKKSTTESLDMSLFP